MQRVLFKIKQFIIIILNVIAVRFLSKPYSFSRNFCNPRGNSECQMYEQI